MNKKKDKMFMNKTIVLTEILTFILSVFAFSFIVGGMVVFATEKIEAEGFIAQGCCLEANDGSICTNVNQIDSGLCRTGLIATSCTEVESCKTGCCYDSNGGFCSLNSPKSQCEVGGGIWSNDAQCNIPQCVLGCCLLADQASITTSRECTNLARELGFVKNFVSLDADGSCESYVGLDKEGACLSPTEDYSGENDCKFTTKGTCTGDFYENFLCTAQALNTTCFPARNTTCLEDKDGVYYLDTCGNPANIYDSSRYNDQSYWEKIILPSESCTPGSADCGNCDYSSGSFCREYRPGKDPKPSIGNYVCRDLNCLNGRKHGESWCIDDYNTDVFASAPVGSRSFKGICMEGEITIEPCADFNQQICIEDTFGSFTEAQCVINDWRSCINANQEDNYEDIKEECSQNKQCVMFSDLSGNEKYTGLPGFRETANEDQGRAGDVGKGLNTIIPWCVPKYTPGMVFWSTDDSINTQGGSGILENGQQQSQTQSGNYGGSLEETKSICSLGSFTCVSSIKRKCELSDSSDLLDASLCAGSAGVAPLLEPDDAECDDWKDTANWECNLNSPNSNAAVKVSMTLEALNERCRSLGSCGSYINVAGEVGNNNLSIKRAYVDEKGELRELDASKYVLNQSYLSSLGNNIGLRRAGSLTKLTAAVIAVITGRATQDGVVTSGQAQSEIAEDYTSTDNLALLTTIGAGIGALGLQGAFSWGTWTANSVPDTLGLGVESGVDGFSLFGTAAVALAAAAIGFQIGMMIAKNSGYSPGLAEQFVEGMTAATVAVAVTAYITYAFASGACTNPWTCIAAVYIAIALSIYENCFDSEYEENQYYMMEYTCEPWEPPQTGDCDSCNNDIRTCSEYRCRSLGNNCHYFNENGEPGYCTELNDFASSTIKPWPEILTENYKYVDVGEMKFKIEYYNQEQIPAWTGFMFGVITDKPSQCKIDNKHTKTFEEMAVDMQIDSILGCDNGRCENQGMQHKIALSPSLGTETATSTLGFVKGENEYYIRCKNYAGSYNRAEFVVKINVDDGEDLTPPLITSFSPESGEYLKLGENSTKISFYINEPSECKYSQGYNNRYEDMNKTVLCMNDPSNAVLGNWPCFADLQNLNPGENKFYFQCQDKPNLPEGSPERRNINRNSKEYIVNVCSTGLNIDRLEPQNLVVTGRSPVSVTLEAETSGCINGGESTCSYRFNSSSSLGFIDFFNTGSTSHSQVFTSMPAGNHNIEVQCIDKAGNTANEDINLNIFLDNFAPKILRTYVLNQKLVIFTDEESECKYVQNSSLGCNWDFFNSAAISMTNNGLGHSAPWIVNRDYYIKCMDVYNNTNLDCGIQLKTY